MKRHYLERLIAENYKKLTHRNIVDELRRVVVVYEEYSKTLSAYVRSLERFIQDINQAYSTFVYPQCLSRTDGWETMIYVSNLLIPIIKGLNKIHKTWALHEVRFQIFLNTIKSNTTALMSKNHA